MVFRNLPEVRSAHEILGVPSVSARFGTAPFFWNWGMEVMTKLLPSVCSWITWIGLFADKCNCYHYAWNYSLAALETENITWGWNFSEYSMCIPWLRYIILYKGLLVKVDVVNCSVNEFWVKIQEFLRDRNKVGRMVELFDPVVRAVDGIAGERVSMRVRRNKRVNLLIVLAIFFFFEIPLSCCYDV